MAANLQEMLRLKAAAVAQAKHDGAIPGNKDNVPAINQEALSSVVTGLQGSTESAGTIVPAAPAPDSVIDEKLLAAAFNNKAYLATGLRKYWRKGGKEVRPIAGYFYPSDAQDIEILETFVSRGKVEAHK